MNMLARSGRPGLIGTPAKSLTSLFGSTHREEQEAEQFQQKVDAAHHELEHRVGSKEYIRAAYDV